MSAPKPEEPNGTEVLSAQIAELIPEEDLGSQMRANYIEQLELIGSTASEANFAVVQDLCFILQSLLQKLEDDRSEVTEEESSLLLEWPALLMSYIESPQDPHTRSMLIDFLRHQYWSNTLSEDDVQALVQMLTPSSPNTTTLNAGDHPNPDASDRDIEDLQDTLDSTLLASAPSEQTAVSTSTQALPPEQQELIDLLSVELTELLENEVRELTDLASEQSDPDTRRACFQTCSEQVHRIGSAAEMVGLEGLHRTSEHIHVNLQALSDRVDAPFDAATETLLREWPRIMLGYLRNIHDRNRCGDLVNCLLAPEWPQPLERKDATPLIDLLAAATVLSKDEQAEPRQIQAHPEDVSLEIPADVNRELLDSLLQELPAHTTGFSKAIQRAIEGEFLSDIDVAQRIAHTLKGAGNVVGVCGITNLTHHLEDILGALSKHHVVPPPALGKILINAADCLEGMSDALLGLDNPPEDALEVLQDVLDWINRIEEDGIPEHGAESDPVLQIEQSEAQISSSGRSADTKPDQHKPDPSETISASTEAVLRIPAALAEELLRLAGESMISTAQIQEQMKRAIEQAESMREQNLLLQQLGIELEQLVDMRNFWAPLSARSADGDFDSLELNQYNELHTFTHRLLEAVTDSVELTQSLTAQLIALHGLAIEQERFNSENQEAVMQTRMVAVNTVEPRLQRSLRQACRMTGKDAELSVMGTDTLVDTNVLNDLMNPLMHLLRNAVDHGIETSEQRSLAGKPSQGSIELEFSRKGDHILVRCEDDGGGLDYETIRQKAEKRGLLAMGSTPSKQELNHILLASGFSTRDDVSQVSGRGIGLDAVHDCIKGMKGTLSIHSELGRGTSIELSIPVTLLATHAIFVRVGKQIVAVANRGVDEMLASEAGTVKEMGSKQTYQFGEVMYESEYLDALLGKLPERRTKARNAHSVLLVRKDDGSKRAVLVQEILDTRNVVVKPLGQYVPKPQGVIGATILGDGDVAPVLDLTELVDVSTSAQAQANAQSRINEARQKLPFALVVDDSLSARRSLAQFVQDIGYQVRTAKDGMEAIAVIENQLPDIMLVDLEMPRMNGLELTSHVRTNEATRAIPVIMVTSRTTEKHRQQANKAGVNIYLTKPFAEDELASHIGACLGNT